MFWHYFLEILSKNFIFFVLAISLIVTIATSDRRVNRRITTIAIITLVMSTFLTIADTVDYYCVGVPALHYLRATTSFLGYAGRPMIAWLMLAMIDDNPRRIHISAIMGFLNTALYATNYWNHLTFWIDEEGVWHAGPLRFAAFFVAGYYVILFAITIITKYRKKPKTMGTVMFTLISATTATAIECLDDHPGLLYPTILVILLFYYIYLYRTSLATQIVETEYELREEKIALSMSQLQPHFISNGMVTIRRLIRKDPEKAIEAMDYFIDYLRETIDSIEEKELVYVEDEIKFVKDYLYIEKLRFGEALTYEVVMETNNFKLPAFSLQPLVENAIRHGIRMNEDGVGHLTIIVTEVEDEYRIFVQDNGPGFNVDEPKISNDGHAHIGISNVRYRLEAMCNGGLAINSVEGVGTTVYIHVPK